MEAKKMVKIYDQEGNEFYYKDKTIEENKENLRKFLDWDKNIDNLEFAQEKMFFQELKTNNLIEGYQDDLNNIERIVKGREKIKRVINLYRGYRYILKERNIDESHLKELYAILSEGLLSAYDLTHMGNKYREASVFILRNGRLDGSYDEGVEVNKIQELINYYFDLLNSDNFLGNEKIDEYLKSQILHYYLMYIHPYFDVNGRTSRTMSMWYLLNKECFSYMIFNRGISFKGSKYDKIVGLAKNNRDLSDFLNLMIDTLKLELEKEHIINDITNNSKYKLSDIDRQTLLYFITMNGMKTTADFAEFYNKFNNKKKVLAIFEEMILPLIDKEIIKVIRETKKDFKGLPNMELALNENLFDYDKNYLTRVKLK